MNRVVIVGGGFSGTLTALQIAKRSPETKIVIIDSATRLGRGLAYSPPSETFKLNVRADAMGAFPEEPHDFFHWLTANGYSVAATDFVPRLWFGHYLQELLAEYSERISTVAATVVGLSQTSGEHWSVELGDGSEISAHGVVLALGNLERREFQGCETESMFLNPYRKESYRGIEHFQELFVIGAGLTAIDFILEAEAVGFKGKYTVLSRHGRLPLPHPLKGSATSFEVPAGISLRELASSVIKHARELDSSQPVIDALRPKIQTLWANFSVREKQQFLRHLKPFWEVHRHRVPRGHSEVLSQLEEKGRLVRHAGRIQTVEKVGSRSAISWRSGAEVKTLEVDAIALCAGPEGAVTKCDDPLIRALLRERRLVPGPLQLGASVHPLPGDPPLYLIGPLQRESLWEITAVRELRAEAVKVADTVIQDLRVRTQSLGAITQ